MGTNVVRLTDRQYMTDLRRRIYEDFNEMLAKRIKKREVNFILMILFFNQFFLTFTRIVCVKLKTLNIIQNILIVIAVKFKHPKLVQMISMHACNQKQKCILRHTFLIAKNITINLVLA